MNNTDKLLLIGSLENIFQSKQEYLTYPVHNFQSFGETEFKALSEGILGVSSKESLGVLSNFSNKIHQIPAGSIYEEKDYPVFWSVYADILKYAEVESNENKLAIKTENVPLEILKKEEKYKECETNYQASVKRFVEAKSKHRSVGMDIEKQILQEVALRKEISTLERDWVNKGHKKQIDRYYFQRAVRGTDNLLVWKKWNERFIEDIHVLSDLDGRQFAAYQINNNLQSRDWSKFEDKDVRGIANSIPPEIESIFRTNDVKKVKSISYEYLKVDIYRSWFYPEIFEVDFWHLDEKSWLYGDSLISDGNLKGLCPSYITDVIFVRNINVEYKKSLLDKIIAELDAGLILIGAPLNWLLNKISPKKESEEVQAKNATDEKNYLFAFLCKKTPQSPKE